MRILVLTTLYPNNIWPNHGIFIKKRIGEIAKRDDCEVKVIAPIPYYPAINYGWRQHYNRIIFHEAVENGIDVYHPKFFMIPKIGMVFYGLLMYLSVLPTIKVIRSNFQFDLIDAHFVYPDGLAALLLANHFRKPVVISARGSDINQNKDLFLIRNIIRFTLKRARRVISVSHALKKEMITLGIPGNKISIIPNGIDSSEFFPIAKKKARKKLDLPVDKKIILSVGNLVSNKGFDLLIKAVNILLKKYKYDDIFLIIVGEGKFRKKLEQLISTFKLDDYVFLAGSKSHHELIFWYNAADLFCLASSREGWPNVLMEALACGVPAVATPVGGIAEIIKTNHTGILSERNEFELAKGILEGLKKDWYPKAFQNFAEKNSWEKATRSILNVFNSVI